MGQGWGGTPYKLIMGLGSRHGWIGFSCPRVTLFLEVNEEEVRRVGSHKD